jgi:hypothetical protein
LLAVSSDHDRNEGNEDEEENDENDVHQPRVPMGCIRNQR